MRNSDLRCIGIQIDQSTCNWNRFCKIDSNHEAKTWIV